MKQSKQFYFFFYSSQQKEAQRKHRNVLPVKTALNITDGTVAEYTFRSKKWDQPVGFDDFQYIGFGITQT